MVTKVVVNILQDVVKDCGILTMSLLKQVVCASVHLGLTSSSVAKSNMVERPQTAELQATTNKLDHRVRDCDEATRRLAPVQFNQINCPKIFSCPGQLNN